MQTTMTLDQLMQTGWRHPKWYVDLATPLPFSHLLPGGIGYVATTGETVHYGKPETTTQFRERCEREIMEAMKIKPSAQIPLEVLNRRQITAENAKHWHDCAACGVIGKLTRHHLIPVSIKPQSRHRGVVRLCRECHDAIHTMPNHEIANTPMDQQIRYIKMRRGL